MDISMINWKLTLHKLFFMHEWEAVTQTRVVSDGYDDMDLFTLRCETCGTLKRKKIKL